MYEGFIGRLHQPIAELAVAAVQEVQGRVAVLASLVAFGRDYRDFDLALEVGAGDFNGVDLGGGSAEAEAEEAAEKEADFVHGCLVVWPLGGRLIERSKCRIF